MKTTSDQQLRNYLDEVDRLLEVPAADRHRLLEEIEGHLSDAIDHRVARGMDPAEATRAAIEEFGPPSDAAISNRSELPTTWTHWLPIAIPLLLTVTAALGAAYFGVQLSNSTLGQRVAVGAYAQSTVVFGGITCAGWLWLRHHRRPNAISPAWLATAAAIVVLVF